jgi:hypothetical protein
MHFNAFDYIPFGTASIVVLIVFLIDRSRGRK